MKLQLILTSLGALVLAASTASAQQPAKPSTAKVELQQAKLKQVDNVKELRHSPRRVPTLDAQRPWTGTKADKRQSVVRLERLEDGMIVYSWPVLGPKGQVIRKEHAVRYDHRNATFESMVRRRLGKDVILDVVRDPTGNHHARNVRDIMPAGAKVPNGGTAPIMPNGRRGK